MIQAQKSARKLIQALSLKVYRTPNDRKQILSGALLLYQIHILMASNPIITI